jgi:hypothetical protein
MKFRSKATGRRDCRVGEKYLNLSYMRLSKPNKFQKRIVKRNNYPLNVIVYFILFAPKNCLQNSAGICGGYSLQLKLSRYAVSVSFAKCPEMQEVFISWISEYPETRHSRRSARWLARQTASCQ